MAKEKELSKFRLGLSEENKKRYAKLFMDWLPEETPVAMERLAPTMPDTLIDPDSGFYARQSRFFDLMNITLEVIPAGGFDGWYPCSQDLRGGGYFKTKDLGRLKAMADAREVKANALLDSVEVVRTVVRAAAA